MRTTFSDTKSPPILRACKWLQKKQVWVEKIEIDMILEYLSATPIPRVNLFCREMGGESVPGENVYELFYTWCGLGSENPTAPKWVLQEKGKQYAEKVAGSNMYRCAG